MELERGRQKALNLLFHDDIFERVRHITDCIMEEDDCKERSHYFVEVVVEKG